MKDAAEIKKTICFLYSNQPVARVDGCYYTRMTSFIEFLAEVACLSDIYRIIVPCSDKIGEAVKNWTSIHLQEGTIEVKYYEGNRQAIIASFLNAIHVGNRVRIALKKYRKVIIAGPGPNSFLFWLSLISPRSVLFVFFIRGDTLETVKHIYRGHFLSPIIKGMVRLFRCRINYLLRRNRAIVFTFGEKLKAQYLGRQANVHAIAPLIHDAFVRKDARPDIGDGPLKVLYVGRFSEEKNVLSLIDAVKRALGGGLQIKLSIVGLGPLEDEIRRRINDLADTQHIVLRGYIPYGDALITEYDSHDVLCLPSKTESIGGVVIEAFARGMPVLATQVGSLPVYFPEEIKFISGMEPSDIEEGLKWCYMNRAKLSTMGRMGWATLGRFIISDNAMLVHNIIKQRFSS